MDETKSDIGFLDKSILLIVVCSFLIHMSFAYIYIYDFNNSFCN